jgi:hypothetical protein
VTDAAHLVFERDPRPHLRPAADRSAHAELREKYQRLEHSVFVHDGRGAQQGDPDIVAGRAGRALPLPAQIGEEGGSAGRRLVQPPTGRGAVEAHRRPGDEVRGIRPQCPQGAGENLRRRDARPQQRVAVVRRPREAADARAVEPDDGVRAGEHVRIERCGVGEPLDLVRSGRRMAHETRDLDAVRAETLHQRGPDQARRARDHDPACAAARCRGVRQASPRG